MDSLEKDIRNLFCDSGPLDREEVTYLLLQMLYRIQKLEAAHGIKENT
jgi:hypothetical protein